MVSVHRRHGRSPSPAAFSFIVACFVIILITNLDVDDSSSYGYSYFSPNFLLIHDLDETDPNTHAMRRWRVNLENACQTFLDQMQGNITEFHWEMKEKLESEALKSIYVPRQSVIINSTDDYLSSTSHRTREKYQFCKHVFIDLGTNRGDSIGSAIDAALDVCSPLFLQKDPAITRDYRINPNFPHLHLDVNNFQVYGKGFEAFSLLYFLQKFFRQPGMESVCVYGMEGNPHFTRHLKKLEDFVYAMNPRPLKHLYIHTETVVTSADGPATLHIDQFSAKNHFWGSSILQSMPDVQRTIKQNNGTVVKARVDGIALSTLIRRTLSAFDPNAVERRGGSLLVKMDIEGAEYEVLKELSGSQWICDYVQSGNNATLVVEFHHSLIKDQEEKRKTMAGVREAKERLRNCGVKFRFLPNYWT